VRVVHRDDGEKVPMEELLAQVEVRTQAERARFERECADLDALLVGSFTIPGLDTDYVPQGVCWMPGGELIALTFHMPDKSAASKLVLVELRSGRGVHAFDLADEFDAPYTGHAGGVAVHVGFVWVASGGRARRHSLDDVLAARTDRLVAAEGFDADARCSYASSDGTHLWLGDFALARSAAYPTVVHHAARAGALPAWAAGYSIDRDGTPTNRRQYEVDGRVTHAPDRVVFTGEKVQGFAVCGDTLAVSTSYGPHPSQLTFYAWPSATDVRYVGLPRGATTGVDVADAEPFATLELPAGAQGLDWNGEHLLVTFEGGARRYRERWRARGALVEDRCLILRVPPVV
jgi:hypothetical protein